MLRKLNCYIIKICEVFIMRMFRQRVEKIMDKREKLLNKSSIYIIKNYNTTNIKNLNIEAKTY